MGLCINDGRELNGIDFLRAKSLLRRDAFYLFRDHKTAFHKLHYLLLSNSSSYKIEKCFDMHFRKKQSKQFHEFFLTLKNLKNILVSCKGLTITICSCTMSLK